MNALRLYQGTDKQLFSARTGLDFSALSPQYEAAIQEGFLETGPEIKTTAKGQLFLNALLERFL